MGCTSSQPTQFDYDDELLGFKKSYSVEVKNADDSSPEGAGLPRRNKACPEEFIRAFDDGAVATIWDAFVYGVKNSGSKPCFGTRQRVKKDDKWTQGDFMWLTYDEAYTDVTHYAMGLRALGVDSHAHVGIMSANRIEWVVANMGNFAQSMVTTAIYDTLGLDNVGYIMHHADLHVVVASGKNVATVLDCLKEAPNVKIVIQMEQSARYGVPDECKGHEVITEESKQKAEAAGVRLIGFHELLRMGKEALGNETFQPTSPVAMDLSFIMYTSGTTGRPKGVMLTHQNIVSSAAGSDILLGLPKDENVPIRHLSYLPLAHIYETVLQTFVIRQGGQIGFFSGSPKLLVDDNKHLRPTVFAGVPRVFLKMHDTIMGRINGLSKIKKFFVMRAFRKQQELTRRGLPLDPGAGKIFAKIAAALGLDEVQLVITGAAPMPPFLMEFMRILCMPRFGVLQGYGLTETSAGVCAVTSDDHTMGHNGPPSPACEIRLVSVPEMKYSVDDPNPRGEVQVRGPLVFQGYYKDPEKSAEALDENGWFSTGDIGRWNPSGTLSIIDRKKNIFKLAQGEYIAVEKIEATYQKAAPVGQVFVYGNSYKPVIVAVIVPAVDWLNEFARGKSWISEPIDAAKDAGRDKFKDVVEKHREEIEKTILAEITAVSKQDKLHGFEIAKAVYAVSEIDEAGAGFTVENGLLTPTFKLKRPPAKDHYLKQLQDMYTSLGEPPKADEKW